MAKISLDTITSGFNLQKINSNFDRIEAALNNQVLYRDSPLGEPNALLTNLDANGRAIYNLPAPSVPSQAARLQDVANAIGQQATANLTYFSPTADITSNNVQGAIEEVFSNFQGNTVGRVVSSVNELKTVNGNKFNRVVTSGYYSAGDGGSGEYFADPSDTTTPDNGGTVIVGLAGMRWKLRRNQVLNVRQFGCRWDGSVDDTVNAQKALDWVKQSGGTLIFPYGTGRVTALEVTDSLYTVVLHSEGGYLEAAATDNQYAMLTFTNCVDIHMTGMWRFNGANKNNYFGALAIRVKTGTSQATTRINIYNPTFRLCPRAIVNGDFDIDYQCSEINVFGANFFGCPQPVYNAGSNTGLQLIGCNISSEHNGNFPGVIETAIYQEGGFVKVTGGSVVTNPTASYMFTQGPCSSALYSSSLYGTMDVVGAHVESNSPLLTVNNPRGLPNLDSSISSFKFIGNTGYAGGDRSRDFIYISDSTYEGKIVVKENNWYSDIQRTGYNVSGLSPLVKVLVDKVSFGKFFLNWLGGTQFGKVIHDTAPILSVSSLGAVYPTGVATVLKYQVKDVQNELARYGNQYNPATGEFTVPPGGFVRLGVTFRIAGTGTTTGDLLVYRGSTLVGVGNFTGYGSASVDLFNLVEGEKIYATFQPYGAPYTAGIDKVNSFTIVGETR